MQPQAEDDLREVTLVVKDGNQVNVPRSVLSTASPFFAALLNSDMRENREGIIRLEHITDTVMRDVLQFMRADIVKVTPTNVLDLIEAAEYFMLPSLKTIAGRYKAIDYRLSPSECISLYYFLEKYQCEELVIRNVKQFIFSNIAAVTESQVDHLLSSRKWTLGSLVLFQVQVPQRHSSV
ncbi:kelch-like protein 21 [Oculina patagonica]